MVVVWWNGWCGAVVGVMEDGSGGSVEVEEDEQ